MTEVNIKNLKNQIREVKNSNKEFDINTNYYEIILNLEEFRQKVRNVTSIKDLAYLISEIKSYIFSKEVLKIFFINRVNLATIFLQNNQNYKEFYNDFQLTYIDPVVANFENLTSSMCIPYWLYYPVVSQGVDMAEYASRFDNEFIGVLDLYRRLDCAESDTELTLKYSRELMNSFDFFIFEQLGPGYIYEYIYTPWFSGLVAPDFDILWAKAVTVGVLHKFSMYISDNYIPKYYNKPYKKLAILNKLKQHKFKTEIIRVLVVILNNPEIKVLDLIDQVGEAEKTVKNNRLNAFNEVCTGKSKGELSKTKELLKEYEFTIEDFNYPINDE